MTIMPETVGSVPLDSVLDGFPRELVAPQALEQIGRLAMRFFQVVSRSERQGCGRGARDAGCGPVQGCE